MAEHFFFFYTIFAVSNPQAAAAGKNKIIILGGISMAVLEVHHLKKIYTTRLGGARVQALTDVNFSVEKGEYVAIMGRAPRSVQVRFPSRQMRDGIFLHLASA